MAKDTEHESSKINESEDESTNVMNPNDFENLETTENKISVSGIINKIVKKNKDKADEGSLKTSKNVNSDDSEMGKVKNHLDEMTIKTDKIEGKLEMINNLERDKDEEISKLTEEIGELRSMIFDREKSFNDILTEFDKIKVATEEIKPDNIKKNIDQKEKQILELEAKLEIETARNNKFEKMIKNINNVYENIKGIDSLTNISKYIDKQIKKIQDEKDYVNRTTSKVEQIFFELNKKQETFDNMNELIGDNKELLEDNIRAIDAVEMKFENFIQKKDMKLIKNEMTLRLDGIGDKMYKMKDVLTKLIEKTITNENKITEKEKTVGNIDSKIEQNKDISESNVKAIKDLEMKIETIMNNDISDIKEWIKENIVEINSKQEMINTININLKKDKKLTDDNQKLLEGIKLKIENVVIQDITDIKDKIKLNQIDINNKLNNVNTLNANKEVDKKNTKENLEIKIETIMTANLDKVKNELTLAINKNKTQMNSILDVISILLEKSTVNKQDKTMNVRIID